MSEAICEKMLENIPGEYQKTPGYPTWDLINAMAIVADELAGQIAAAESKINVDNLSGEELTRFIEQRKGIERKAATHATGVLNVIGNGTIKTGDIFESKGGVRFEAVETAVINESGQIVVAAINAGNTGNVGANSITEMPVTIAGINSVTNLKATAEGYEEEANDELRERYYIALRTPPTSGNKYHYKTWAMEVVGVGDAKVFPLFYGENTVQVIIIDANRQPADDALINRAQQYIDPRKRGQGEGQAPIGAYCHVESAIGLSINIEAKLTLEEATEKEVVELAAGKAITEYLKAMAFKEKSVSYAKIGEAILTIEGVLDYEGLKVNNGNTNIAVEEKQVAVMGQAVWIYA